MLDVALLVTCEHAVNHIPARWQHLYHDNHEVLETHRGWDPGAAELAHAIAKGLHAPCFMARVSRLLLDHNRSPHNRSLWSEFSRDLPASDKALLLDDFYHPFRDQAGRWIAERHADGNRVIHLSVHSFAPVLDGEVRRVDVGILYDEQRSDEAFFADLWKSRLAPCSPQLRVRFNVPYRGRSDCHLATYRGLYKSRDYVGIELEINQSLVDGKNNWSFLQKQIIDSLRNSLVELASDE